MQMKILLSFIIVSQLSLFKLLAGDNSELLDRNIEINKLTDNVYSMKSSFAGDGNLNCNHLLIIDNNDVVLVNTPVNDSLTAVMLNCIKKKFKKPVTKVIVSHFHEDSSGGLIETARCGIVSYGQDKTREFLKQSGKKIDIVFSDSLILPLKTVIVELMYFGGGHSRDNIVVWLPKEKILFGGCLLKSLSAKDKGNTKDADMDSWANTVRKVKERFKDAKIVIPGHMESGDPSIFEHTIDLVKIN
jgi:metallo-beta-lactamase class B